MARSAVVREEEMGRGRGGGQVGRGAAFPGSLFRCSVGAEGLLVGFGDGATLGCAPKTGVFLRPPLPLLFSAPAGPKRGERRGIWGGDPIGTLQNPYGPPWPYRDLQNP